MTQRVRAAFLRTRHNHHLCVERKMKRERVRERERERQRKRDREEGRDRETE